MIAFVLVTLIWLALALFWHGFWRLDQRLDLGTPNLANPPSVAVLIPARNEEATIRQTLSAILQQEYPGETRIVVADDSSTDATGNIARGFVDDRLTVINAGELPGGWAGKMWALNQAVVASTDNQPDYYWFTDADILHKPGVLAALIGKAENSQLSLVSEMVALRCETFWEKLLVPAFIFYFSLIYPFRAINNPRSAIAGAAGGSILVRRDALAEIGGISALKDAVIDDCTLARLVKRSGRKIWLGHGERSTSLRGYNNLGEFWRMVQRSAYTQLNFSPLLLVFAIAGLALSHILPVIIFAWPALAIMAFIYWPTVRFYGLSPLWTLTLPLAATLFGAMTVSSALSYHLGWQNRWRDREVAKRE